ncbi:hypothetical protein B2H99_11545 [Morganella morganii]|nr:hypothetical protein B2H99_11545 [Morganella morganii]OQP33422.1 hypothetical protein B2I00_03250 [Morganella morganii]SSN06342.1 Uncharacterised protein [Klebsiella pneumoniae]
MLVQTVKDYRFSGRQKMFQGISAGTSASPRGLVFQLTDLMTQLSVNVLNIGFGTGMSGTDWHRISRRNYLPNMMLFVCRM